MLQWRNDTRFHTPMATSPVGSVFLKDVVAVLLVPYAQIANVDFFCLTSLRLR